MAVFVAIAITFILSSLITGTQIAIFVQSIRKALLLDIDYPLSEKLVLVKKAVWNLYIATGWAGNIAMLLSDLIVIWRAWALLPYQRRLILLPFILWIGSAGTTVACCSLAFTSMDPMLLSTSPLINILSATSLALSVASNAVTTLLIACKLWSYRTFIMKTLGLKGRTSPVQTILILLVDTGLVFLGIQIAVLVLALHESRFTTVFQALCSLSVIYPTLVIVLVETQRSMTDICEISPSNASKIEGLMASDARAATLGHLSFTAGTIHSTMDDELASHQSWSPDGRLEEHGLEKVILEVKESEVNSSC